MYNVYVKNSMSKKPFPPKKIRKIALNHLVFIT